MWAARKAVSDRGWRTEYLLMKWGLCCYLKISRAKKNLKHFQKSEPLQEKKPSEKQIKKQSEM